MLLLFLQSAPQSFSGNNTVAIIQPGSGWSPIGPAKFLNADIFCFEFWCRRRLLANVLTSVTLRYLECRFWCSCLLPKIMPWSLLPWSEVKTNDFSHLLAISSFVPDLLLVTLPSHEHKSCWILLWAYQKCNS